MQTAQSLNAALSFCSFSFIINALLQETPTTLEEPISNGVNHEENENKEQESELVNNEAGVEESTANDNPITGETAGDVEETKEKAEVTNEAKSEEPAKESSEEESEEESE